MTNPQKPQQESYRPHEGRMLGSADVCSTEDGLRLRGSHCLECDARVFPADSLCPFCLSDRVEPIPLSPTGSLYSFTIIHIAPAVWQVPYGIGYVDLPEGVRIFGKLADADGARWKLDQQVRLEVTMVPGADDLPPQYQYLFNAA